MTGTKALIGGVAGLSAVLLCACTQANHAASSNPAAPAAPQDACMEIMSPPGTAPGQLRAVAYQTPSIEQCAEYLEGLRIERGGRDVWGIWNGVYIYADAQGIDAQKDLKSERYPLYTADQRAEIDKGLRQLAAQKSSKPAASKP
jgi:hypothetical protein